MSGVLDRQEVIAVLDAHEVGRYVPVVRWPSYREVVADALMALTETRAAFVQVQCTDMEDYARIHNEGYAEAVRQFGEVLADARQDLAPEAAAGDLLAWLDDAVKAMEGGERDDGRLGLVSGDGEQGLGTCSPEPIPDEAVDKATGVYGGPSWKMRAALEAAAPLLSARPLLDRAAVDAALIANADSINRQGDAVLGLARPMPTREEIAKAIHDVVHPNCQSPHVIYADDVEGDAADAVLALLSKGDGQ